MLKIDLHLHTIASRHAYNTILEYINQAKKNRMKIIGFADHGPGINETLADNIYFRELYRIPKLVNGVRVLKGAEVNFYSNGGIGLTERDIKDLDYVMAGLHKSEIFKEQGIKKNTDAVIKTIESGKINIISHPFKMSSYETDIETVAEAACKNKVLPEVNVSYLAAKWIKTHPENLIGLEKMIKIVKQHKQKVIVGSDAHCIWELGDDSPLKNIKKQIGLTDDLIINNYPKELMKMLKIK